MADEPDKPSGPKGPEPITTDPDAMRSHGPAESGDRVALQGRLTIQTTGGAAATAHAGELGTDAAVRLTGAEARARAGGEEAVSRGSAAGLSTASGVGASIAEATGSTSGRSSETPDEADFSVRVGRPPETAEERFETLRARVAALEVVRRSLDQIAPGPGHNRGPNDFEPASADDLAEIDHLIGLLKQQTATTVVKRQELVEAEQKTSKIAEKIKEYLDIFFKDLSKSFGAEIGKQVARAPLWYGLYATLSLVTAAAAHWLQVLPL